MNLKKIKHSAFSAVKHTACQQIKVRSSALPVDDGHTMIVQVLTMMIILFVISYGLDTLALSELHQHKLQVCENNWIWRMAGVRRVERRKMKDLRQEVGTKACIVLKIVKSRMK